MAHIQDSKFIDLGCSKVVSDTGVVSYHRHLDHASKENPILVLLHGYPQSSYIWRHMIPLLPGKPIFVPDLPGYGNSGPTDQYDKVSLGLRVIEALRAILKVTDHSVPIVLIGHDRGARVAHALHVSAGDADVQGFRIVGLVLFDIVPTSYQWEIGDSAAAQSGYFHWSFLANVPIAKRMITAYGGGNWAMDMISRWRGTNSKGIAKLEDGDALAVYNQFFDNESVIEASCRDYEAGAKADVDFETAAMANGKTITAPLLLVYSQDFLTKRAKEPIPTVWGPPWTKSSGLVTDTPVRDGIGHFVPEEAPELAAEALLKWLTAIQAPDVD